MRLLLLSLLVATATMAQPADSLTAQLDRIVASAHAAGASDGVVRAGRGEKAPFVWNVRANP